MSLTKLHPDKLNERSFVFLGSLLYEKNYDGLCNEMRRCFVCIKSLDFFTYNIVQTLVICQC